MTTKIKLKSFTHQIHYVDNVFQAITLHLSGKDITTKTPFERILRGVHSISHSDDDRQYITPAAVFAALWEHVTYDAVFNLTLDEPDNYTTQITLTNGPDVFEFCCREYVNPLT